LLLVGVERRDDLAHLTPGPRAALLLRLIAGLDLSHAAQVLGVTAQAYEMALRNALEHRAMDDARMQALRESLHQQIHVMSQVQKLELTGLRTKAMSAVLERLDQELTVQPEPVASGRWVWAGLAMLLVILLVSILWSGDSSLAPGQDEALPTEAIAPAPELSDTVVVTQPDYLQLAHPEQEKFAGQLALLSWVAAASPRVVPAGAAPTVPVAPSAWQDLRPADRGLLASAADAWSVLDAETRTALVAQAHDWQSRSLRQREELRERVRRWNQQDANERARRRVAFLAWQELDALDQQQVRAAALHVAALSAIQRRELREQFGALPADSQRLWAMGPALGQELAPIAALFAFMPEDERPALLAALRGLNVQARADLVTLAPRLGEKQRQALRRELLAAEPAQRPALIRQRLAQ